ncbi:SET domain-containing protein [Candidatus Kaiserbacteria bacterium]|nr:SET domain-containing protein [Candidatus Kaiserbacteria bacterium]
MKKISVVKSAIHGRGLVAKEPIKKGEFIGTIKGPVMYKVNKTIKDTFSHPDWVGFKKNYWTDPLPPAKYLNHSCEANSGIKGTRTLHAVKDIKEGEEVTIDYSTTELDLNWFLDCQCSSKKCRNKVTSIQNLPKEVFNSYLPFVPTYNKTYYIKYCT